MMQAAHGRDTRLGVLLINLGTPDAPTPGAIRRYLREFLSDRRVVELPRALWWLILNAFILPLRPRRLAHAYQSVWTDQGSPLLVISRRQQTGLQARLGDAIAVELGMRYGQPSIAGAMAALRERGATRILVLPLYPQYSATTTATAFDAVFDVLRDARHLPELRTLGSYHDEPGYIDALVQSVQRHWSAHGRGEHLLLSFHSIPLEYLDKGDPYYCHCQKTARLLAEQLDLSTGQWSVSFQSRVGRARWLMPYTDEHVLALAGQGIRNLDVICPGFSADCLETLEEVALRYGEDFRRAGGQALRYIPALNDDAAHLDVLQTLCMRHLQGWQAQAAPQPDAARVAALERVLRG